MYFVQNTLCYSKFSMLFVWIGYYEMGAITLQPDFREQQSILEAIIKEKNITSNGTQAIKRHFTKLFKK